MSHWQCELSVQLRNKCDATCNRPSEFAQAVRTAITLKRDYAELMMHCVTAEGQQLIMRNEYITTARRSDFAWAVRNASKLT